MSKKIVKYVARSGDFQRLPFNSELLKKITEDYFFDNRKLVTALKKPLPVDSEAGLRHTMQSFLSGQ